MRNRLRNITLASKFVITALVTTIGSVSSQAAPPVTSAPQRMPASVRRAPAQEQSQIQSPGALPPTQPSSKRRATLKWKPTAGAVKYEVQLGKDKLFDPPLQRIGTLQPQWVTELEPGTYYYRVRPWDKENAPGAWSEIQGFIVNPNAPQLEQPPDGSHYREKFGDRGVEMTWSAGAEGTQYPIEIRDSQGIILKRYADSTRFVWKPKDPGTYRWRAGFETQTGTEWSGFHSFVIEPSALPPPPAPVAPPKPTPVAEDPDSNCAQIHWLSFEGSGEQIKQSTGGSSSSGRFGWTPHCAVSNHFGLRANIGGSLMKGASSSQITLVDYSLLMTIAPSALFFDFGIGAQTWLNYGTYWMGSFDLGFQSKRHVLGIFDRIFVGYSRLFAPNNPADEFRFGVGFGWN